ncbi:hypothetical protein B0H10DRAFT_1843857, partial [Mycena sp. CBHHK59/15]
FSFHTLGEDYVALIRRFQFDIDGAKLGARKEVEVTCTPCARAAASRLSFTSSPRAIRCWLLRPTTHIRTCTRAPAARAVHAPERLAHVILQPNPDPRV